MDESIGKGMIEALLKNPRKFSEDGTADKLLQEYLRGFPVETLRPLLRHQDSWVYSAAIFIACEMSDMASSLVDDVLPLIKDEDPYVKSDALDSVMMCTFYENFDRFIYIILALEGDVYSRRQTMLLVSNATEGQLNAALADASRTKFERQHKTGLSFLLRDSKSATESEIMGMTRDDDPIIRIYGAIAMRKFFRFSPDFVKQFLSSDDEYVRVFAQAVLDQWEIIKSLPDEVRRERF